MNSFLKKAPVIILVLAISLCLSACGSTNSASSRPTIEESNTDLNGGELNASGINVDVGDIKVKVGEKEISTSVGNDINVKVGENGISTKVGDDIEVKVGEKCGYTKVGDDITVETSGDRVKVNVGGISVDVNSNEAGMVSSILSSVSSMFSDDDDSDDGND